MNENKTNKDQQPDTEKISDLKEQTVKKDDVKKGYNEKNPAQPEGAFKPDSEGGS